MIDFLSPSDLGARMGITPDAVRVLCARGEIPGARRIGRRWYISRRVFEASFEPVHDRPAALPPPPRRRPDIADVARIARAL